MLQSNQTQVSPFRAAELTVYYWSPNVAGVLQAWGAVVPLTPLRNSARRFNSNQGQLIRIDCDPRRSVGP